MIPEATRKRRALLLQARQQLEHDRCGPDLKARCGCVFLPWRRLDRVGHFSQGIGLIEECDLSGKLWDVNMAHWETHIYVAREDAQNQLEEIIRLISGKRIIRVPHR